MKCACEQFKKNMDSLTTCLYASHVSGLPYRGDKFKFCPWCGGEVDEVSMTISKENIDLINGLTKSSNFNTFMR